MSAQVPTDPSTGKPLWTCTSGICRPNFAEVLGWFQGLQRAINAYLARNMKDQFRSLSVVVDGEVGPKTLKAYTAILKTLPLAEQTNVIPPSTDALAHQAQVAARVLAHGAATAPNFTPDPKTRPPASSTAPVAPLPSLTVPKPKSRAWVWWTVGALGITGAAVLGTLLWRRRASFAGAGLVGRGGSNELEAESASNPFDVAPDGIVDVEPEDNEEDPPLWSFSGRVFDV